MKAVLLVLLFQFSKSNCIEVQNSTEQLGPDKAKSIDYWEGNTLPKLVESFVSDPSRPINETAAKLREELYQMNTTDKHIIIHYDHSKLCPCSSNSNSTSHVKTIRVKDTTTIIYRTLVSQQRFLKNESEKAFAASGLLECTSPYVFSSNVDEIGAAAAFLLQPCGLNNIPGIEPYFDAAAIEDTGEYEYGPGWWINGEEYLLRYATNDAKPFPKKIRGAFLILGF